MRCPAGEGEGGERKAGGDQRVPGIGERERVFPGGEGAVPGVQDNVDEHPRELGEEAEEGEQPERAVRSHGDDPRTCSGGTVRRS